MEREWLVLAPRENDRLRVKYDVAGIELPMFGSETSANHGQRGFVIEKLNKFLKDCITWIGIHGVMVHGSSSSNGRHGHRPGKDV